MSTDGFELVNGVYRPIAKPGLCHLFVDESNLADRSATVQAAIFVPDDWYRREGRDQALEILRDLGSDAKEFKASGISKGNRDRYERFLRLYANVVAGTALQGHAYSIVALDGPEFFPKAGLTSIERKVEETLAEYGVLLSPHLLSAFVVQLAWLLTHGSKIVPSAIANPIAITFDAKHRWAEQAKAPVFVQKDGYPALLWESSDLLTRVADTASVRKTLPASSIESFTFKRSEAEFGLQAADLFANLYRASLNYLVGVRDERTELRHEMLASVAPGLCPDAQVTSVLALVDGEASCTKGDLVSRWELTA